MITEKDIMKMANLARLEITEDEIPVYVKEINNMLSFAGSIDITEEVIASKDAVDFKLLREDILMPSFENPDIISNAPQAESGFFKLRKKA